VSEQPAPSRMRGPLDEHDHRLPTGLDVDGQHLAGVEVERPSDPSGLDTTHHGDHHIAHPVLPAEHHRDLRSPHTHRCGPLDPFGPIALDGRV